MKWVKIATGVGTSTILATYHILGRLNVWIVVLVIVVNFPSIVSSIHNGYHSLRSDWAKARLIQQISKQGGKQAVGIQRLAWIEYHVRHHDFTTLVEGPGPIARQRGEVHSFATAPLWLLIKLARDNSLALSQNMNYTEKGKLDTSNERRRIVPPGNVDKDGNFYT